MFKGFKRLSKLVIISALLVTGAVVASSFQITNKGYIEVYDPSGNLVSRHTEIKEAYESVSRDAEAKGLTGTQEYVIKQPEQRMTLFIPQAEGAEVADDTLTGVVCPDGLIYVGGCPGGPQTLQGYFVDATNGNDNNTGTSHSTAWKTLSKVNQTLGPSDISADVWLLSGQVFEDQTLTIDWPGTSTDKSIVGCYKLDGSGNPEECTDVDPKPEINGSYPDTCSDNTLCDIGDADDIPSGGIFSALVNLSADHITFKRIAVHDSAGRGVQANTGTTLTGLIVERLDVDHSAQHSLFFSRITDSVIRNNTVTRNSMCDGYSEAACAETGGNVDDGNVRPWAGAITLNNVPSGDVLIEGNIVNRTYGEGISLFGGSRAIVRNNTIGHSVRPSIYVNHWPDFVIEGNIVYGDPGGLVDPAGIVGMSYSQDAIGFRQEVNNGGAGNQNNSGIARNNVIVGVPCISLDDATTASVSSDIDIYGNSCVGTQSGRTFIVFNNVVATDVNVENNIFYSPDIVAADQCVQNIANVSLDYDLWAIQPSDTDCVGINDVIGDPLIATTYTSLITQDYTNPPAKTDFELQTGSPAISVGSDLTATDCLTTANFTEAYANMASPKPPTIADWGKCLKYDTNNVLRQNSTIGALEADSAPPGTGGPAGIKYADTGQTNTDLLSTNSLNGTASISHPIGSAEGQLLVCGVTSEDNFGTINAVTYNGINMTPLTKLTHAQGNNEAQFFYMLDVNLPGAANSYTAQVTTTGDENGQGGIALSCITFQGTHQKAPKIYSAEAASTNTVTNTTDTLSADDYLYVIGGSSQNRTTSWSGFNTIHDLQKVTNNDTSAAAAYKEVLADGTETVTEVIDTAATRILQQVAWVEAPYDVFVDGSTLSTGFCADDGVTNLNATYLITSETPDGGEFRYFDGCGFTYTAGAASALASFTYKVIDYNGLGDDVSYTVTVTVP